MNETINALLERLRQFRTTRSGKGVWLGDGVHAPVNVDEIIAALELINARVQELEDSGWLAKAEAARNEGYASASEVDAFLSNAKVRLEEPRAMSCGRCGETFNANDASIESTWQQVRCPACGRWEDRI